MGFLTVKNLITFKLMTTKTRILQNLMTIPDYAKDKGVSTVTVYNWINDKKIETVSLYGKTLVDISTLKK